MVNISLTFASSVASGASGRGGGMVYFGALKKSILQGLPYLVILAIPIWTLIRDPRHRLAIAMLFQVPAGYIGFYSYFAWHGGISLNLRYFVPVLPFTSILTA